jgi:hypothetical protein
VGASDLTTELPGTGNGEVVDGDRPAPSNGHVAKRRKRQKALAVVAANGHVPKVALRKSGSSNGAVVDGDPPEAPAIDEVDRGAPPGVDVPAVQTTAPLVDDEVAEPVVGEAESEPLEEEPADASRRGRRRAAKAAMPRGRAARRAAAVGEDVAPRGRAARRAKAARPATPAARRALLVATAAEIAAAAAAAEAQPAAVHRRRAAKVARRLVALIALAMVPAAVYALVVTDGPASALSRADATFMSAQLMTADQRVRRELVRLRPGRTFAALARTRDATLTTRSLTLELANAGGRDAELLRRALRLETAWLDAVGSVLSNPRSALRDELVARDAVLRPAMDALPVREGRRKGGAAHLVRYAKSRDAAKRRDR